MQRSEERDLRERLLYDVAVKGLDANFWDQDTGTSTISSNKLRNSSASLSSYAQFAFGDFEFAVNVPTSPAAGIGPNIWGLRNIGDTDNRSGAFFMIDTEFWAVSYNDAGTRQRTAITFDSDAWDGAEERYRIVWEAGDVTYLVNDTVVARHFTSVGTSGIPQALRIDNDSASNLDVGFVTVRNARIVV